VEAEEMAIPRVNEREVVGVVVRYGREFAEERTHVFS
jgi:hypothetical protein